MTSRTRKTRFHAALKAAGLTQEQWRVMPGHPVSRTHLNKCWKGERKMGTELKAAIDRFIKENGQ
jgi:hypothetical protein